ncbi:glycosyltransferase family 4 protein [Kribbella qitaiheensis]|uniref:Glycosyltransferase family 4 protein n=1 Tax=Kribbella qitaiheensis TaxID=1544730 RepID=A0A7G6X8W2_9ACTN|nr:glycosyltransferase family 4 protein [Kribbella qitaiheensis]QNE22677.1 glycosyltransferase family 4 protein [Kribbella qitaiheensis]
MRIALVSDVYLPSLGGIEMHLHDLALELIRAGHVVTVFTVSESPSQVSDVPVVRLPAISGIPTDNSLLLRHLLEGDFDLVHAHSSLFSPLAWAATRSASQYGVPVVITMHSLPAEGGVIIPWMLAQLDRGFGPEVRWTAVSEVVAASLRRALPGRPVEVLHNGIDPQPWQRPHRPDHVLTVVSTMRLTRRKRPAALLRILADIRSRLPAELRLRAVVVGSGPQGASMARAVRRSAMDWVELPGRLTRYEIQQLYSAADVYLAPAELESFGVAALEARCAGLGVVAMASGGVGEFVRPGIEGFLVDTDAEMAAVTVGLLTSPDLLKSIQAHNRFTEPAMTWQLVIGQHLGVYDQVLTQSALSDDSLASALIDVPTIMELDR